MTTVGAEGFFPETGPTQSPPPSWLPASLAPEVEDATYRYLETVQDVQYSLEAWNKAVAAGTDLLRACGGWRPAVGALRRGWRDKGGDHFAGLFDKRLDDHLPSDLLTWVRKVAQEGVDAHYRGTQRATNLGRRFARSVSEKGRVIWDARVVNELCSKDDHSPAAQPKHAEVVRLIVWYQTRYPGVRILLAKKDISEAFKWLWVTQEDCRLFGADLPGEPTEDHRGAPPRPVTVLYLAMTFGWTGAPGEFMAYAWAVSLALMDDSVVIEPDVEEGALTTRKLIWGLEFDTEAGTCRLPPLKVERAYHLLQSGFFDAGQREVPLKEVQVLRGSQQFWLGVLPQLAPYLRSTNALLGPPDEKGHVVLRGSLQEREDQWPAFWDAIELQRLLVGSRQFWETRFASQLEQALTTPELIALPEVQSKLVWVSADATPTRLGAIDWSGRVESLLLARRLPSFCPDDLVQIGVAELLALLVLVVARKEEWSGSVILYLGDNTNVQDWLLKRQAGNSQANFLLKVLGALEGVHGLHVRGAYLRTYHNQSADDLTRLEPEEVMRNLGLEKIEVPSDWSRVLEEAWVKRALLWLGQPEADRGVALQLAERRAGFEEGKGEPGELAPEQRTGACYLAWEQETEELVKRWLAERLAAPSRAGATSQRGTGGSRRKEEKAQRLRGSFRARSDADRRRLVKILRHEAHFLGIPVREDGWVSLRDLNYYVGTTSREDLEALAGQDNKQRLVLYTDRETWIAAESGHSMSGVVGPGRELSAAE
ncbi:unnamed protein product, partial [Symbiodinium microadriaticum]